MTTPVVKAHAALAGFAPFMDMTIQEYRLQFESKPEYTLTNPTLTFEKAPTPEEYHAQKKSEQKEITNVKLLTKMKNTAQNTTQTIKNALYKTAKAGLGGTHFVSDSISEIAIALEQRLDKDVDPDQVRKERIETTRNVQVAVCTKAIELRKEIQALQDKAAEIKQEQTDKFKKQMELLVSKTKTKKA